MPKIPKRPDPDAPAGQLAVGNHQVYEGGQTDRALESPTVRLVPEPAQGMGEGTADLNQKALTSPTVRLATTIEGGATSAENLGRGINAPSVRLAHVPGAQGDNNLLGQRGVEQLPPDSRPALLVSYYYLEPFLANKHRYAYRNWVLDSGAFSAHNSGAVIDIDEYIRVCHELKGSDSTLTEIFALDDIGDWRKSLKNTEYMWGRGVEAIPTFHFGEPWDLLVGLARDYPKIALGGLVGQKVTPRDKWIGQCFARVWPKRIHGFGLCGEATLMKFPFHSVDATNWEIGPCKYGVWRAFGRQRVSVRGSKQNLRAEVEFYLDLERRVRERWKKEMEKLESLPPTPSPTLRLAVIGARDRNENSAFLPQEK